MAKYSPHPGTASFQKCQYFEPETPNSWLLAPDSFVSKLQFSLHGRGLEAWQTEGETIPEPSKLQTV